VWDVTLFYASPSFDHRERGERSVAHVDTGGDGEVPSKNADVPFGGMPTCCLDFFPSNSNIATPWALFDRS